jgi:hypothetical protein
MIDVRCETLEALLKTAMQPELLGKESYLRFELEKGFTIEIV